ncbi:Predicted arabinose efflux permease, MFS family [Saccharopolyspora kobensis]|uniref:Predicted arabinose efflux permease, MFS family n=1 Tax=Saccharopolyspora kobensis TaxID=146035 RepID=A0A1H6DEE4_9PSEU|nr:MFS transporter [Saccharopolyspora kobensis]SEG83591.1 Predicted arabinose efflux permease, MFS family [Saccharopolyspora kobensis]SFE32365.1 Predicted arabinose efflux permease, MFS family [Saccharopolyspora kobensis]
MGLFAIRDYRRLFGAQVIALFGTGLATVALGLLAYDLAGPRAGAVLATALTIKMVAYVVVAPLAAAYVDRLPRRWFLTALDVVRALVVLALPFVTEVWQIYVLIGVLQTASAAFTPTFQAVIPDIVTDEADYTRALSASQVASTMESLLSPVLAAVALTFMTFNLLFLGTSVGFAVSALLVLSTRIPDARPSARTNAWDRAVSGIRTFAATPSLRGVMALNLVVAAAGSIVVVNTVNYVRDVLGGTQSDVAWMLAASGTGTLLVALVLPRVLDRVADRLVMLTGAAVLLLAVGAAVAMSAASIAAPLLTGAIWVAIGGGMALIITPTGRVLRRAVDPSGIPEVFAAQFSLSHLAWLVTYPIAGWVATRAGFTTTWTVLAALAAIGALTAMAVWPRTERVEQPGTAAVVPAEDGDLVTVSAREAEEGTLIAGQCSCVRTV